MVIVRAFGGTPCWAGADSPYSESDDAITHAVVDRPAQAHKRLTRAYVQPQWVFDSANFRVLAPVAAYAPGRRPPPHLSPFLDYSEESYVPEYARELLALQEAAAAARQRQLDLSLEGTYLRHVSDCICMNQAETVRFRWQLCCATAPHAVQPANIAHVRCHCCAPRQIQ